MKCPVCYEQDNFEYQGKGTVLHSFKPERVGKDEEIYRCNFCYSKMPESRMLKNWEYGDLEKRLEDGN